MHSPCVTDRKGLQRLYDVHCGEVMKLSGGRGSSGEFCESDVVVVDVLFLIQNPSNVMIQNKNFVFL